MQPNRLRTAPARKGTGWYDAGNDAYVQEQCMETLDSTDIAALAEFGAWLAERRPAISTLAAHDLTVLDAETRLALGAHVVASVLAGLGHEGGVGDGLAALLRNHAGRVDDESQLHSFVDALRGQLVEAGLDALSAGVPNARAGLHTLLRQVDAVHREISRFYHGERTAEMRRMHARLDQILATTPLSSIEWSKDGSIVRWNPAAERIFGWTPEEAIGRNIVALLVPDAQVSTAHEVARSVLNDTSAVSLRHENVRKDGRVLTCQWYNAVLRDEQGEVIGALSQIEDVTEELRAEEALRESQDQLIMSLRELSTPLIPLDAGVVAMPLIGAIDSTRAQQVIETLLDGVSSHHARVAILDITGVSVVDTQVANALIRAAQAVKLLGARVVLTGIRPEVAQTLVGLGVDLAGIVTRSTLQAGIAYAMDR
jgi:PAS domain S-box-containing protein